MKPFIKNIFSACPMNSKIKLSTKTILFTVAMLAIAVGLALAVYNRPSEKILKLTALAEQGDSNAQFELGSKYLLELEGLPKDDLEAMKWFNKSADQGNAEAQFMLGWMYQNIYGVRKDLVQAYMWYRLAAKQDSKYAKFRAEVEKDMTQEQLVEGERLAIEWKMDHP